MLVRYILFIALTTLINMAIFYYIIVFSAIYHYTSAGWAISSIECLVFKLVIAETVGPLSGGFLRRVDKEGDR
jgi:hypothetical protein